MAAIDWTTIATFATAIGTLVLAVATFAAVRSANTAARVAEAGFLVSLRPVLVTSKLEDPMQKVRWIDDHWAAVGGSQASFEVVDGVIYLVVSLRNVGSGIAVLFGWSVMPGQRPSNDAHREPDAFRMQTRDLYIPAGDIGFWQGAIREDSDPDYDFMRTAIQDREHFTLELLYGDHEGGQRTITRFGMTPRPGGEQNLWFPSVALHWNLDRPDPR